MKRILFVCHGNICRSPMAEYVMAHLAAERGVELEAASAATSQEELGHDVHPGTRAKLAQEGIFCGHRAARQLRADDYARYDLIVGMDHKNLDGMYHLLAGERGAGWSWPAATPELAAKADPAGKVSLLLDWTPNPRDVADPWYTGDFDATFVDCLQGCTAILDKLAQSK